MRDPVVPLRLALYGHPDSGSFWEQHCEERLLLKSVRTTPGRPGFFAHDTRRVILAVYVDDCKLAGVEQEIEPAWKAISDAVNVEPPQDGSVFGLQPHCRRVDFYRRRRYHRPEFARDF